MFIATLISALFLPQQQSPDTLTLLKQGESRGGYTTYLQLPVNSPSLYRAKEPATKHYVVLPEIAVASAAISPNHRKIQFQLGGLLAVNGDLTLINRPAGRDEKSALDLVDAMSLRLAPGFASLLSDLKEKYPSGVIQADDRRDRYVKLYEAKLSKLDIPKLENSLSILLRAALKKGEFFRVYLYIPQDNGLDPMQFEGVEIASVALENRETIRTLATFPIELPAADQWKSRLSTAPVKFYEALSSLDRELVTYLSARSDTFPLKNIPESAWRRDLIEKALPVYYQDPDLSSSNTCDSYSLALKDVRNSGAIEMNIYVPSLGTISIPQKVLTVEAL